MSFNGWPNYPTWCVYSWLTNDPDDWSAICDLAREALAGRTKRTADATGRMAARLREYVEDGDPLAECASSVYGDLLGFALSVVDWYRLAEAFLDEVLDESARVGAGTREST